jgi:DNA-binding CsgD family transcriptional regulator
MKRHEPTYVGELQTKQNLLAYQNTILLAAQDITSLLLQSDSRTFEDMVLRSMEIMGKTLHVDRVYIWENHTIGAELHASQAYEWAGSAEPQQHKALVKNVSYRDGMPNWENNLSKGRYIKGLTREMPQATKAILSAQGIVSLLVVPIFVQQRIWGFIGFDDCRNERNFLKDEELILSSSSRLIANSLIRNHMEETIQFLIENKKATNLAKYAYDKLSSQELRLGELIMQGYANPEIAAMLHITENTVKGYRKSLYSKLQIHSRRELFELAENGLTLPPM